MKRDSLFFRIKQGIQDTCYIMVEEIRNEFRDEGLLIFCVIVPLFYPLLYSWIYNNEVVRDVPVAVVDLSHSNASREFIRMVDGSPDTKIAYFCASLDEAKELTGKQQVHGTIFFPRDFETKLRRGEQVNVSVYCDMSLMLTYKAIYQTTQAVASEINSGIQISQSTGFTNRDDEITTKPLDFDEVPIFNTTSGYGNAILPGVLVLILQQTLLLGIGLSAGTAREKNRYQNLVPIEKHYNGIFRIVLGKSAAYFALYMVMAAYITLCVPRMFHFVSLVTAQTLIGLMVPFLLAVIFFGLTMSCLVRYRENVMLLVVFTSVPLLFMTGISWPQSNIPWFWEAFSWIFPSTFGVRGFLRISSMGATLPDIKVEYQALWIQALVYFFTACIVYRYQIILSHKRARARLKQMKEGKAATQSHGNGLGQGSTSPYEDKAKGETANKVSE